MTPLRFLPIGLSLVLSCAPLSVGASKDDAPKADPVHKPTKRELAQADFKAISAALLVYRTTAGQFPTEAQGLGALIKKPTTQPIPPRWLQLMEGHPKDPWGNNYGWAVRIKDGKEQHLLVSKGPDPASDKDDIEFEVKVPEPAKKK
jgi:general secretion pathway protein G